jgi:hypothetical protein
VKPAGAKATNKYRGITDACGDKSHLDSKAEEPLRSLNLGHFSIPWDEETMNRLQAAAIWEKEIRSVSAVERR